MSTILEPAQLPELRHACIGCGLEKNADAYYHRSNGRRDTRCKECRKQKVRDLYWADPHAARESRKLTYRKHKIKILAANRARASKYAHMQETYQKNYRERLGIDAYRALRTELSSRRRARIKGGEWEKINRAAIIARDNSRCHLCGRKCKPHEIELDHLIPVSKGGPHIAANLAVAHASCNRARRDGRLPAQLLLVG